MSKLGQAGSPAAQEILRRWREELGEVAGAIATRNRVVEVAAQRVDRALKVLVDELTTDKANVEICIQAGVAYQLPNELPFALVADLDSFLFEARSAYELTVKFIWIFLRDLGSPKGRPKPHELHILISAEIAARNGETAWIEDLRKNRHAFIHDTAAWPALRVTSIETLTGELVLLTRNVTLLDDPSSYVSLHVFREIYRGFCAAFGPIEAWLSAEIDSLSVDTGSLPKSSPT